MSSRAVLRFSDAVGVENNFVAAVVSCIILLKEVTFFLLEGG